MNLFQIFGVVCLGGGLFLKFGQNVTINFILPVLKGVAAAASQSGQTVNINQADILEVFDVAAYLLIGIGAFMLFVGFLGCCGACCDVKCMLGLVSGTAEF